MPVNWGLKIEMPDDMEATIVANPNRSGLPPLMETFHFVGCTEHAGLTTWAHNYTGDIIDVGPDISLAYIWFKKILPVRLVPAYLEGQVQNMENRAQPGYFDSPMSAVYLNPDDGRPFSLDFPPPRLEEDDEIVTIPEYDIWEETSEEEDETADKGDLETAVADIKKYDGVAEFRFKNVPESCLLDRASPNCALKSDTEQSCSKTSQLSAALDSLCLDKVE
jgi:hypothetical protein